MAKKKKGKKGKKDGNKPKTGISALEKAQLVSKIAELQEKVNRRVECCEEFEEVVSVYQDSYKRECEEKESMVRDIKQTIAEVNLETQKLKDTFLLTESKQNLEISQLQTEFESLGKQKEIVEEKLSKEIKHMEEKFEELERFREETVSINKRIEEAEEERISQDEKFQHDLQSRNRIANKLLQSLKSQLVHYLKMKASELNERFAKRPDPKYLRVIEQSLGLEDTVSALSEWMVQLEEENNSLKAKAADMHQKHEIMRKNRHERVAHEQGLREFISLLCTRAHLHDEQIQATTKRSQQIERTQQYIELLESKIQELKIKYAQMKEEWEEREADIRASEVQRLTEQEFYMRLRTSIQHIHEVVKREAERELKECSEGRKSAEMILNELFSCDSRVILDGYTYTGEQTSGIQNGLGYHAGSGGILFKKPCVDDAKVLPMKENKRKSSQTKKASLILPSNVDIISANLLSEIGLLGKFDIAKRK